MLSRWWRWLLLSSGKFCLGLSGAECSLNDPLGGAALPSTAPGGQRSMAFVIESEKCSEQFKAGDVVVSARRQ